MSRANDAAGRWREILQRQSSSGLSVAAFCRRSRISQASFYTWRRRLRDGATPFFAEVHVTPDPRSTKVPSVPSPTQRPLELVLLGGRSVVVRPGFDAATLLALVSVLERGTTEDDFVKVGSRRAVSADAESGA
ncbi:MAG: hypothetical protein J5J06_18255 [Phycisphaerae bacterium]|nr:hypothetical protein [Phycisphaerae bacterium]